MFEAFSDSTRRSVFLAQQAAIDSGRKSVGVQDVLLGVLTAEPLLAFRLFKTFDRLEQVRQEVTSESTESEEPGEIGQREMALNRQTKRIVAYAAAEAENLNHATISPAHLLLGIVRDNTTRAAQILSTSGITIEQLQAEAIRANTRPIAQAASMEGFDNLVSAAGKRKGHALVGRSNELDQIIQILCRRKRSSPVLIGEAGVGKDALVKGIAERIANNDVPGELMDRPILQVDAFDLAQAFDPLLTNKPQRLQRLADISAGSILYVRGLFDQRKNMPMLAAKLSRGQLQLIVTASPLSYRLALDREDDVARNCEAVGILPLSAAETVEVVAAAKDEFETFHGVVFTREAVQTAVSAASRFLPSRSLLDGALDLIDDAGARSKLQRDRQPPGIARIQRQLREILKQMERAIANYQYDVARKCSEEEKAARATLKAIESDLALKPPATNVVTPDDVIASVALRMSLTPQAVRNALQTSPSLDPLTEIRKELSASIPAGRRDWIEGLFAYLQDCDREAADRLGDAIKNAKSRL